MNRKEIPILVFALLVAVSAWAMEQKLELHAGVPGDPAAQNDVGIPRAIGAWIADGAELKPGFRGGDDYVLENDSYDPRDDVDLLLHLDHQAPSDAAGNWEVSAGRDFVVDHERALFGGGAGAFRGPASSLSVFPGPNALFAAGSNFHDFSLEFWLYPATAENGEVILEWQSLRKLAGGVLPQQLSCVIANGRLEWTFSGFFARPGASRPSTASMTIHLRGISPLVPLAWSHHLIRFNGDTGLLEYQVDGRPEADTYVTASGHEGGTVYEPVVGAAAPIRLAPEYSGLVDELRLSRTFVQHQRLKPYGRDGALVLSPVADLGFGYSRLVAIDAQFKAPGTSTVELSYRIAEDWADWRLDYPAWIPFRAGEALPEPTRGRYVQVRAKLYPDGSGKFGPSLSSFTLRFVQNPPPPPPARLIATPLDGAVRLRWTEVPESDVAGYLVYYGDDSGQYFGTGAQQGPSPIDAGKVTSILITDIPNGRLLYFAVAAYDTAAGSAPGGAESRAGALSAEVAARPSRTPP